MSQDYVDIALCQVGMDGDFTVLEDVSDISVDVTINLSVVKTMNRRRKGRGYRKGVKEVTGTLTVEKAVSPEFPWEEAMEQGKLLQFYYDEAEGGRRWHLEDMRIADISDSADEGGESQQKISFLALDKRLAP